MAYTIIPTPTVKRFFNACVKDKEFLTEMKEIEGIDYVKPTHFSNSKIMVMYAATYGGWLLGKGNTEKYKKLDK